MYGLPEDFNTDFLLERTLERVCINENQFCFHFGKGLFITVESAYSLQGGDSDDVEILTEVPAFNSNVLQLLGSSIRQGSTTPDGTLVMELIADKRLRFSIRPANTNRIKYGTMI